MKNPQFNKYLNLSFSFRLKNWKKLENLFPSSESIKGEKLNVAIDWAILEVEEIMSIQVLNCK